MELNAAYKQTGNKIKPSSIYHNDMNQVDRFADSYGNEWVKATWRDYKVTGKKGELMEMTEENFTKVCAMRDELIFEQKDEIAKLKMKINRLEQRLEAVK